METFNLFKKKDRSFDLIFIPLAAQLYYSNYKNLHDVDFNLDSDKSCQIGPKKNICLFPICCHFNQWVGREFILFFILFFVTSTNR